MDNNRVTPRSGRYFGRSGFSLIELLVVVGVIAVFLSVFGVALNRGGDSAGMDSSQRMLSALVSGARGQAVMKQEPIYLLVSMDRDDPTSFLRSVQIATSSGVVWNQASNAPQTDAWGNKIPILSLSGNPTQFSRGVFIVPSRETITRSGGDLTTMFSDYDQLLLSQGFSMAQIDERKSNGTYGEVEITNGTAPSRERFLYYAFTPRGFTGPDGYRIVFASGERGPTTVSFSNPNEARGFLIRPMGSITMISDPRGFDEGQAQ
jgi:prepilin-type N-terminal cleavage/methylation domain-containing protein